MASGQTLTPWWKSNPHTMGKPVKVWTPDPTRYHPADSTQSMRVGSGSVGNTAMIPRGNNDGSSKGFDAGRAGVFIVDPDEPGGGVAIDPAALNNDMIQDALARVGPVGGDDEEEQEAAFAAMSIVAKKGAATNPDRAVVASEADERPARRRAQQSRPRSAVVPQFAQNEQVEQEPLDDLPEQSPTAPFPSHASRFPTTPVEPTEPEPKEAVQMSQAQAGALLAQLLKVAGVTAPQAQPVQPVRQLVRPRVSTQARPGAPRIMRPKPVPPPVEEVYEEDLVEDEPQEIVQEIEDYAVDEQEQTEEEVQYEDPEPAPIPAPRRRTATINRRPTPTPLARQVRAAPTRRIDPAAEDSIDSLHVTFLTAKPSKPTTRVIFNLGKNLGNMQARYHGVVKGAGCVILVYDTRYEDGNQWSPPSLGASQPITVILPETNERFIVASMGLEVNMGALDMTVLVLPTNDPIDEDHGNFHAGAVGEDLEQPV